MTAWTLLGAADIEPYLKLIGLIVAVSIMAINHLLAGLKKARAQLPPPPDAPVPAEPIASAAARQDLNAEVKEFLRRAAQQRSGHSGAGQRPIPQRPPEQQIPARQPNSVVPVAGQRNEGRRGEGQRKQKRKSQQPKPSVPTLEDSLAHRHMSSRLESTALDERAEQLSNLDKPIEIDVRMQQSLDHPIGQLTSRITGSEAGQGTADAAAGISDSLSDPAADIAGLLSNPQSIRTAIILNEILARPTDRW